MNDDQKQIIRLSLTVPALNRLLGGDSELEVAMRHQVVEYFCKEKLTPLFKSEAIQELLAKFEGFAQREFQNQIGTVVNHYNPVFRMTDTFQKRFNEEIKKALQEVMDKIDVRKTIIEYTEQRADYWKTYADRQVGKVLDEHIEKKIKEGIDKRLADAAART